MPTVADLLIEIRDMLNEPTAHQFSNEFLVRAINEANRDLARATRHIKGTVTVNSITSGVSEYSVDPSVIAIEHAYYIPADDTSRMIPLEARHYEGMDAVWGQWQNNTSTWPQFFTTMGFSPSLKIKLFPVPSASATLRLIVSRMPAALAVPVVPTATAEVPAHWYDAIVDYVEAKALRRDHDQRWSEARQLYVEKRDNLIENPDYLAVNREMLPTPTAAGYLPAWLVESDD